MTQWVLPQVVAVNHAVTRPVIEKKTGLTIVSAGKNFGEVVTNVDIGVSDALLNGGIPGVEGLRSRYPGSFSEEQDSAERLNATAIYEVDPIDGTGDFKETYNTDRVMSPTTLVTKLVRDSVSDPFRPVAGMIFEIVNEYALIGDGKRTGLFVIRSDSSIIEAPLRTVHPQYECSGHSIRINRRFAYPQDVFDKLFPEFLKGKITPDLLEPILVGGAGMQALQYFRKQVEPAGPGAEAFANLEPIDVVFNCQPDWKTWDTDPARIIAKGMPFSCMVYGSVFDENAIEPNAAAPTLAEMWHRSGCMLGESPDYDSWALPMLLRQCAKEFQQSGLGDLLSINY